MKRMCFLRFIRDAWAGEFGSFGHVMPMNHKVDLTVTK